MEREIGGNENGAAKAVLSGRYEPLGLNEEEGEEDLRSGGPTWRGLVLAVISAIVLSVGTMLLLGGSLDSARGAASTGCGPGSDCCPPADSPSGGR